MSSVDGTGEEALKLTVGWGREGGKKEQRNLALGFLLLLSRSRPPVRSLLFRPSVFTRHIARTTTAAEPRERGSGGGRAATDRRPPNGAIETKEFIHSLSRRPFPKGGCNGFVCGIDVTYRLPFVGFKFNYEQLLRNTRAKGTHWLKIMLVSTWPRDTGRVK